MLLDPGPPDVLTLPPIPCAAALMTYVALGNPLTASVAFPALALFNLLRFPVLMFPQQAGLGRPVQRCAAVLIVILLDLSACMLALVVYRVLDLHSATRLSACS